MAVLAYDTLFIPATGVIRGYTSFIGSELYIFSSTVENVLIWDLVYADLQTLPAPTVSPWVYIYYWKASISQAEGNADLLKTFASNPNRYDFGHLCVTNADSAVWDDVWKFEDQQTPFFRGYFYTDIPNPNGSNPLPITTPVESSILIWSTTQSDLRSPYFGTLKGNDLGLFPRHPGDYAVKIDYIAFLSYDAITIASNPSEATVGFYP